MNSRERVLTALNHQKPDRTPRLLYGEVIGYVPAIEKLLKEHCADKSPRQYFEMDITGIGPNPTKLPRERFKDWQDEEAFKPAASAKGFSKAQEEQSAIALDEWGIWAKLGSVHHFVSLQGPLRKADSMDKIKQYPWPDLDEPYRYAGLSDKVKSLHDEGVAVAGFPGSVFEQICYVRGFENIMQDMVLNPDIASYLFERAAHYQNFGAIEMAKAGIDIILLGSDVASQTGLMMSIPMWQQFLKGHLTNTVKAAKEARSDVKVFYHSDGDITPLIPELIDTGIDILNPLQPECLNLAEIKQKYGDRLSFWGAVSVQHTMPFGSPDDVRNEVRQRLKTLGHNGGYILCPAHVLEPEVPWENVIAFFEAANEQI